MGSEVASIHYFQAWYVHHVICLSLSGTATTSDVEVKWGKPWSALQYIYLFISGKVACCIAVQHRKKPHTCTVNKSVIYEINPFSSLTAHSVCRASAFLEDKLVAYAKRERVRHRKSNQTAKLKCQKCRNNCAQQGDFAVIINNIAGPAHVHVIHLCSQQNAQDTLSSWTLTAMISNIFLLISTGKFAELWVIWHLIFH